MELKANELRIGNLVYIPQFKSNFEVGTIYENGRFLTKNNKHSFSSIECAKPIPLTEEWLLKFGFEYKYGCFLLSTNKGTIQIEEDLAEISSVITHDGFMSPCKFVHQLQNLFFALTGEELTIKM